MKKVRILALVLAVLCVLPLLAACGTPRAMKISKIINGDKLAAWNDDAKELTSVTLMEDGIDIVQEAPLVAVTTETVEGFDQYRIYNIDKLEYVGETFKDTEKITWRFEMVNDSNEKYSFIVAVKTEVKDPETVYTAYFYDRNGNKFASKEVDGSTRDNLLYFSRNRVALETIADYRYDLVLAFGAVYRINKEGTAEKVCDWPTIRGGLPHVTDYTGVYYYEELSNTSFAVYDRNLALVSTCSLPTNGEDFHYFVMANGDVLVQMKIALPDAAKEYDFQETGKKYDLFTAVCSAKKGTYKEIDFGYYFDPEGSAARNPLNEEYFGMYNEKILNYIRVYPIEKEGGIDGSDAHGMTFSMDNKGKLKALLAGPGTEIDYMLSPINEEYLYTIELATRQYKIYRKDGSFVGSVDAGAFLGGRFLIADDKIYDLELELLLDCEAEKYELLNVRNNKVVLEKDGIYYLFNGKNDLVKIGEAEKSLLDNSESRVEVVKDIESGTFTVYSHTGKVLKDGLKSKPVFLTGAEGTLVMRVPAEGGAYDFYALR